MEFKGTKGKWIIMEDRLKEVQSGFRAPIVSRYGQAINSGYYNAHSYGRNKEQCLANALLISKAPEMLEMLIRLVDRMEENDLGSQHSVKRAKQLIKEATEINFEV